MNLPSPNAQRPIVLVVEEHDDTRALYALSLSTCGFDVVAVRDTGEALSRAAAIHPDIIVTDLPTPHDDGEAFLHELRRDNGTRAIPVVAVSGHTPRSQRPGADAVRFAAFFRKPCMPDELASGLRQVLDAQTRASVRRR